MPDLSVCVCVFEQAGFWSALPATLAALKAAVERFRRGVKPQTPATPQVNPFPFNRSSTLSGLMFPDC